MIKIIPAYDVSEFLEQEFPFFDFSEYILFEGYEASVFGPNRLRFLDESSRTAYFEQEDRLTEWFLTSFVSVDVNYWIRPAEDRWVTASYDEARRDPYYRKIRKWLTEVGLTNSFRGAVGLVGHREFIGACIRASLRGYMQTEILLPNVQLIGIPCDHGDVHLYFGPQSPVKLAHILPVKLRASVQGEADAHGRLTSERSTPKWTTRRDNWQPR